MKYLTMASFVMDDEGKVCMSSDKVMMLLDRGDIMDMNNKKKKREDTFKPVSSYRSNGRKLIKDTNMCDLLIKIQENINKGNNKCILNCINNDSSLSCDFVSYEVDRKVKNFCNDIKSFNIDKMKSMYDKEEDENEEEYELRLMYLYMEKFHDKELKNIKCRECIRRWMISSSI